MMDKIVVVLWFIFIVNPFKGVHSNSEVAALIALKNKITRDPYGALSSWDPTLVNPCTWFHITCNNDNGFVIRIDLGNFDLRGQLVRDLGNLKSLQYLDVYKNEFYGNFPPEIFEGAVSLVSVDLYNNKFSGPIPKAFAKLKYLKFLMINNNLFDGCIPIDAFTCLINRNPNVVIDITGNPKLCTPFGGPPNCWKTCKPTPSPC